MKYFFLLAAALLPVFAACTATSNWDFYNSTSVASASAGSAAVGSSSTSQSSSNSTTININITNALRNRYSFYRVGTVSTVRQSDALLKDFESVRQTEGWMAFVRALQQGDACVNSIADEPILQWRNGESILKAVSVTRDAWRRAASFGIEPPKLAVGHIRFNEGGLSFHIHVLNGNQAVLLVRASRGQLLGIFDLILASNGSQHVATHMLERVFARPAVFLNTPWDDVMTEDALKIEDVRAVLDRVEGTITVK